MSGAAGGDPAAFDEVDPRGARLHANVATAAENRFHLALDGFDAHGAADGYGFAVNDADGVCAGVVGTRGGGGGGGGEERGGKHCDGSEGQRSAAQEANRVVESRHQRYSRDCGRKSRLYYTSAVPQTHERMMTTPKANADAGKESGEEAVNVHYDTRLPDLTWSRRIQIPFIAAAVYSVIRTLGPTLRYEVLGWQHAERV